MFTVLSKLFICNCVFNTQHKTILVRAVQMDIVATKVLLLKWKQDKRALSLAIFLRIFPFKNKLSMTFWYNKLCSVIDKTYSIKKSACGYYFMCSKQIAIINKIVLFLKEESFYVTLARIYRHYEYFFKAIRQLAWQNCRLNTV